MIVPGPAGGRVDLEGDLAAQALAGGDFRLLCCSFCHVRFPSPIVIARSESDEANPFFLYAALSDCFAALAMTVRFSRLLQLPMNGIIRIPRCLAAIKRRAVIGRQRESVLQAARQIGIGNEDAAERDGVGVAG